MLDLLSEELVFKIINFLYPDELDGCLRGFMPSWAYYPHNNMTLEAAGSLESLSRALKQLQRIALPILFQDIIYSLPHYDEMVDDVLEKVDTHRREALKMFTQYPYSHATR